jgi:hypothetical protein
MPAAARLTIDAGWREIAEAIEVASRFRRLQKFHDRQIPYKRHSARDDNWSIARFSLLAALLRNATSRDGRSSTVTARDRDPPGAPDALPSNLGPDD